MWKGKKYRDDRQKRGKRGLKAKLYMCMKTIQEVSLTRRGFFFAQINNLSDNCVRTYWKERRQWQTCRRGETWWAAGS